MTVFAFIGAEKADYSVSWMVELLGVSRSGYYAWKQRSAAAPGPRATRLAELTAKILGFHQESDGVNGAPRIQADLRDGGDGYRGRRSRDHAHNNIAGISPATWHPVTTIGDGLAHSIPDLVGRRFDRGALDLVWTSDITYLPTAQGWLYLCAVRDGCSRRVLGWAIADHMRTELVETALRRAVSLRGRDVIGVIFHADRGSQYTSTQIHDIAVDLGVRVSVGLTGVCLLTTRSRNRSGRRSRRSSTTGTPGPGKTSPFRPSAPGSRPSTTGVGGTPP